MNPDAPQPRTFAYEVAEATGLAGMLAIGSLQRCCKRAHVDVSKLTSSDLSRVLPYLAPILELYLSPAEAQMRMARLQQLAAGTE
jgi:hypothetical protein